MLIHSKFLSLSRHACLVPNAVFHSSIRDFEYNGYKIPKDTVLISSLYHVMYDPENFKDPELFQPERYILIWFFWLNHGCNLHSLFRFINQERKFVNSEKVVPFGIGKRYCLGRSLAEKEYFLFFSGILQQFKLENVPGSKPPNYSIEGGKGSKGSSLIRAPPQFEIVLKSRI